ncbi:PepSY domain-containing protein (plasmid) [Pseudoalteromonas espejiana]
MQSERKGPSRFWLDSHNLVGIASLPFHLIIAFTVVVFAFHDLIYDGLSPFTTINRFFSALLQQRTVTKLACNIEKQLLAAKNYAPGYEAIHITLSRLNTNSPTAIIKMSNESAVVRGPDTDYLFLQPYTFRDP